MPSSIHLNRGFATTTTCNPMTSPRTSVSPPGLKFSDKGERVCSISVATAVACWFSGLWVMYVGLPFLGSKPTRIEASGPRQQLLDLKGSGVAAVPLLSGTTDPPTDSIAAGGTADAGRHAPPGRAATGLP